MPDRPPVDTAARLPESLRYVAIEGVIGVGKTSLARRLAARFDGRLVLEAFEENPFLARFYEDRARWAFQTQLAFLASRFRQQQALPELDLFHRLVVSDYTFDKDCIFARVNLEGDELQLYHTLFALMEATVPTPDLVVYLRASTPRLLANIARRGRSYEAGMDPAYLEALRRVYDEHFQRYTKAPVLVVEATAIDFVENKDDLNALLDQIATEPRTGTTYVKPQPGRADDLQRRG